MTAEPDTRPQLPPGAVEVAGKPYMPDARGALVPLNLVKPQHLLQDEIVRKIIGYARDLSEQIKRFKGHCFTDLNGLQSLLEQEYDAKAGGAKGNVSFISYDGRLKVQVQIADVLSFGPELQPAKRLVDECLIEWGAESRDELRALINRVFSVDKEGQINRAELFSLLRLDIPDERWRRAMDAIRDAIRIVGTRTYLRFYERDEVTAPWHAITIDLAAA